MAIVDWFKCGVWVPHFYRDVESGQDDVIIIANEKGYRISSTFDHSPDETVYPHCRLVKCECIYCGKTETGWEVK